MPSNEIMSVEGQLVGMPLAGPESFSQQQLDYLKRALGVDETVLWDGNGTSSTSVSLSENIANFERVRVTWVNNNYLLTAEAAIHGSTLYFGGAVFGWNSNDGSRMQISGGSYTISNNGTTLTAAGGNQVYFGNSGSSYGGQSPKNMPILKVVGIKRIAGGN